MDQQPAGELDRAECPHCRPSEHTIWSDGTWQVARCHVSRWGDGSEDFRLWTLARPAGMMQGRRAMLAFWDDVLPPLDDDLAAEHLRVVAEHLAAGGGEAFPDR